MAVSDFIAGGALVVAVAAFLLGRRDLGRERNERAEARREDRARWETELDLQRPLLAVDFDWNIGESGVWLGVMVTAKPGRPGTSVVDVGFELEDEIALRQMPEGPAGRPSPDEARGNVTMLVSDELTPVEPGSRQRFTIAPGAIPWFMDADTPLVPYAIDIEGMRHVGRPLAIFDKLAREGWEAPDDAAPTFAKWAVVFTHPPERVGERVVFSGHGPSIPYPDEP
jgi:hypothetical protein